MTPPHARKRLKLADLVVKTARFVHYTACYTACLGIFKILHIDVPFARLFAAVYIVHVFSLLHQTVYI